MAGERGFLIQGSLRVQGVSLSGLGGAKGPCRPHYSTWVPCPPGSSWCHQAHRLNPMDGKQGRNRSQRKAEEMWLEAGRVDVGTCASSMPAPAWGGPCPLLLSCAWSPRSLLCPPKPCVEGPLLRFRPAFPLTAGGQVQFGSEG